MAAISLRARYGYPPARRGRRFGLLWNIKGMTAQTCTCLILNMMLPQWGASARVLYRVLVAAILIIAIGVVRLVIGANTIRADLLSRMQKQNGRYAVRALDCDRLVGHDL